MKIAVHLHVFYKDLLPDYLEKLNNLEGCDYDLFVTTTHKDDEIESIVKDFNPKAIVKIVENNGYDIGPFVDFLHQINLNDYDYILKLHTKNSKGKSMVRLGFLRINRELWAKKLVDPIVGTKEIFQHNLSFLNMEPQIGMIADWALVVSVKGHSIKSLYDWFLNEAKKLKLKHVEKAKFVAGTMFLARANIFQVIKDNYTVNSFEQTNPNENDGTKAHLLERLLGAIVYSNGYYIKRVNFTLSLLKNLSIYTFFYQKKRNKKGNTIIKILKIPVYYKK